VTPRPTDDGGPASRRVSRDSAARRFIVDIGAAASRRHAIPAWFAADVTDVLPRLDGPNGGTVTTYVVASVARAVARQPRLHALLDLRRRVVTFASVDVTVSVEVDIDGQPFPMNHVLRGAQARSLPDLQRELHGVKAAPRDSDTVRLADTARWFLLLPHPVRSRLLGVVHRLPDWQRKLVGTVGVTSVGMYGRGGGLGLPFLVHTLDVLVGGLERRPGYDDTGAVVPRDFLSIAMVADHDIVDGAPLARFVTDLRHDLETGSALVD
jgi:pyruvate/2-oxoglutarate dehydrogenase complex dihydrolipoamide acyltransferase (E2) component